MQPPILLPGITRDVGTRPHGRDHGFSGRDGDFIGRYARTVAAVMYNASGLALGRGNVVVISTANPEAFTTSNTQDDFGVIGVTLENIAIASFGLVAIAGFVDWVIVNSGATQGQYLRQSTTTGTADGTAARTSGTFGVALTSRNATLGTSEALLFPHLFSSTVSALTSTGLVDITGGGLRFRGQTPDPAASAGTTGATLVVSGQDSATQINVVYFTGATRRGAHGFDSGAVTLAGVAKESMADLYFYVNGSYRAFFDDSDSGRLILGSGVTTGGSVDITAGGFRVRGGPPAPAASAGTTNAQEILSGQDSATTLDLEYYTGATLRGSHGYDNNTGSLAGVAKESMADLFFYVNGAYRAFFDASDSGRLILGGGSRGVTMAVATRAAALNTTYTPSTSQDVLVCASIKLTVNTSGDDVQVTAVTDSASPPTTIVGTVRLGITSATGVSTHQLVFLVKAGNNYRLNSLVNAGAPSAAVEGNVYEMAL